MRRLPLLTKVCNFGRFHSVMAVQILVVAVITVVYFLIRYFNRTDIPKIKGIPEIPGVPIFGNLLQLGDQHATVTGNWAKKFGPVFQVRMGNKVGVSLSNQMRLCTEFLIYCLDSVSYSPTAMNPFVNCGLRTRQLSFPARLSTPSTASSPAHRGSLLELPRGMIPARNAARQLQLH